MNRRLAREIAYKMVFIRCANGEQIEVGYDELLSESCDKKSPAFARLNINEASKPLDDNDKKFIADTLAAVTDNFDFVKSVIAKYSEGFDYERIFSADRALLHLAITEILFLETPPAVAANEAVSLAKAYSTDKSAPFINGILASVIKHKEELNECNNNIGEGTVPDDQDADKD